MQAWSRFQSTHSLRSATPPPQTSFKRHERFNPRTPCGVRQDEGMQEISLKLVSIHALLAECDSRNHLATLNNTGFQSTHSLRSATQMAGLLQGIRQVSIHALLAECDGRNAFTICDLHSFNPRTPCGVRLLVEDLAVKVPGFNPRTPCGVRHGRYAKWRGGLLVSIHALLAECDCA